MPPSPPTGTIHQQGAPFVTNYLKRIKSKGFKSRDRGKNDYQNLSVFSQLILQICLEGDKAPPLPY